MRKAALTTFMLQVTLLAGCSGGEESYNNHLRRLIMQGCVQVSSAPSGVVLPQGRFGTKSEVAVTYECPARKEVVFK